MLPTLFEVGGVSVPAYAVCTILAYSLGLWWLYRGARRVLSDVDALPGLFIALMIGGGLGARLMHIVGGEGLVSPAAVWAELTSSVTGLAFLGGVTGGTAGAVAYMGWARLPALKLLDVAAPGLMLGLASGRLGCLLAGCCHGRVVPAEDWQPLVSLSGGAIVATDVFPYLAVLFRRGAHGAIYNTPVFPTQLMEVLAALSLAAALAWMWERYRRFDGQVFAAMLLGYGAVRWWIEGFRGDVVRGAAHELAGIQLSTGRISSLGIVVCAVLLVCVRVRRGVAAEPVARPVPSGVEDPPRHDLSGLDD